MRAFSYVWSLPVTWQRWRSHDLMCRSRKLYAAGKLHGSVFTEPKLLPIEVLYAGIGIFNLFVPVTCDLHLYLDPMTFIHKLDPHSMEIHQMCKYELTVASPGSVSPGAATDGVTLFFPEKTDDLSSHGPQKLMTFLGAVTTRTLSPPTKRSFLQCRCKIQPPKNYLHHTSPWMVSPGAVPPRPSSDATLNYTLRLSKVIVWQTHIHTTRQIRPTLCTTTLRVWSKIFTYMHQG